MTQRLKDLYAVIEDSVREIKKKTTSFHAKIRIVLIVQKVQDEIAEIEAGLEDAKNDNWNRMETRKRNG